MPRYASQTSTLWYPHRRALRISVFWNLEFWKIPSATARVHRLSRRAWFGYSASLEDVWWNPGTFARWYLFGFKRLAGLQVPSRGDGAPPLGCVPSQGARLAAASRIGA